MSLGSTFLASDLFAEDDRVKLGKKQWQLCVSCHGAQGYGNAKLQAPAIAGLPAWYSVEQLTKFKGGIRGKHPQHNAGIRMYAMARMLKPKDIENVSHYVASLKPKKQERTLQGDPVAGEKIYQTCAACHGAKGLGNKVLNSPPLIHSQTGIYIAQ